jgi:hypothetical protein
MGVALSTMGVFVFVQLYNPFPSFIGSLLGTAEAAFQLGSTACRLLVAGRTSVAAHPSDRQPGMLWLVSECPGGDVSTPAPAPPPPFTTVHCAWLHHVLAASEATQHTAAGADYTRARPGLWVVPKARLTHRFVLKFISTRPT